MSYKIWVKILVSLLFTCFTFMSIFNYTIDPLWNYNHSNKFNNVQKAFNERQQKSNYIYTHGLEDYEGILLGSSRTTFINQNEFNNMKIYNYASNSMFPYEYKGYIDFAKEVKRKDFKYIIIGLDFFSSNLQSNIDFEVRSF